MKNFILIISLFVSILCVAQESQKAVQTDKASFDDSINKTQQLLRTKSERDKIIPETSDAQKADGRVKALAPDEKTQQEYYELAADIMNNYREEKDEEAMKKSVEQGGRDPSAFLNGLTPEQKAKVKALSEKLSPAGGQTNP